MIPDQFGEDRAPSCKEPIMLVLIGAPAMLLSAAGVLLLIGMFWK